MPVTPDCLAPGCHAALTLMSLRRGLQPIPLRFRRTPTGGSCVSGCHRPLDYDRERPARY